MNEFNENEEYMYESLKLKFYDHLNHCYKIDTSTYEGVELLYQTFIADQNNSHSSLFAEDGIQKTLLF